MALSLAIPLFGLNNDYFSALNAKLLNIERERNLQNSFDSGRDSPSTGSETSGISSFITSAESTPISSRSETPIDVFCRNQDNNNKTDVDELRIMFRGRNILNLGSNIRLPFWQLREQTLTHQDYQNFVANRRTCHQLRDQALTNDYPTRCCKECGFYTPSPII